jgi:hypothetical protein
LKTKSVPENTIIKKKSKNNVTTDIINTYLNSSKNYNNEVTKLGIVKNSDIEYIQINDMNNYSNHASITDISTDKIQKEYNKVLQSKTGLEQLDDELKVVDYIMPIILNELSKTKNSYC